MGEGSSPFRGIKIGATFANLFGWISCAVGIAESISWLSVMGAFGPGVEQRLYTVNQSYGGISGHLLAFLTACGIWCGFWVTLAGICGCCMRLGQPSDKNIRIKNVFCVASAINAILFCPVQIAVYAYLFKPETAWIQTLALRDPLWWAIMFQSIGIATGVLSFFTSIAIVVIAVRTKPYAGQAKDWSEFELT